MSKSFKSDTISSGVPRKRSGTLMSAAEDDRRPTTRKFMRCHRFMPSRSFGLLRVAPGQPRFFFLSCCLTLKSSTTIVVMIGTFSKNEGLTHVQMLAKMKCCCQNISSPWFLETALKRGLQHQSIAHAPLKMATLQSSTSQSISATTAILSLKSTYSTASHN